jgi:hypothetical protein
MPNILPFTVPPPSAADPALAALAWTFRLPDGQDLAAEERRYRDGENPYPGYRDPADPEVVVCLILIDRRRNVAYLPGDSSQTVPAAVRASARSGPAGGREGV